jgi:hypothetical protein
MKNHLLKNVTFYSLNKKLKLKMHIMNVFWVIMGYTEKHKDITEAIRDAKGGMRRYWNLMEGSRGTLGRYMDVTEECRAMLACMALDPYVTSMYPTGLSSIALPLHDANVPHWALQ